MTHALRPFWPPFTAKARENPRAMAATQPLRERFEDRAVRECRLVPVSREHDRLQQADLAAARAIEQELCKLGQSEAPIVTLSTCLKLARAAAAARENSLWASEEERP